MDLEPTVDYLMTLRRDMVSLDAYVDVAISVIGALVRATDDPALAVELSRRLAERSGVDPASIPQVVRMDVDAELDAALADILGTDTDQ